jgi:uncharacterized membrane protein HdeD (DUF308 family)
MTNEIHVPPGSAPLIAAREWPTVLVIGIITIAIGAAVLVWPSETLTVISVLLGIQLLIFGLFRLVGAFAADTAAPGLVGFVGILGMVGGVIVLRNPFETVEVLATIVGVVWIVAGAIEVIEALANGAAERRGWLGISGMISIVAGLVVVVWPAPTVTVLAWVTGLYLVIFGLFIAATAISMRGLTTR